MLGWSFVVNDTSYSSMDYTIKAIPFGEIVIEMLYWDISRLREMFSDYPDHGERITSKYLYKMVSWFYKKIDSFFDGWKAALLQESFHDFTKTFSKAFCTDGFVYNSVQEYQLKYFNSVGIDPLSKNILLITIEQLYNWFFFELVCKVGAMQELAKRFFNDGSTLANICATENIVFQKFSLQVILTEGKFAQVITAENFISALLFDMMKIMERDITIHICANCGKFFIPPNRSDTKYCPRISPQDESKTCQEYGAYSTWAKKTKEDEIYSLYRRIYMQKQMMAKRNPDISSYRENFEQFKMDSKIRKRQVKEGALSADDYLEWLKHAIG